MKNGQMLAKSLCSRDSYSVGEVFRNCYPRIFGYIYAKTFDVNLAEDIAQQTFVNALSSIDSFRWIGKSIDGWLFKIAHNLLMSHYRRLSKFPEASLEELENIADFSGEDAETVYFKKVQALQLRKSMKKLSDSQQVVLRLRFFYGLDISATAFLLDRTQSWVKVVQHRALIKLRTLMVKAA